MPANGSLPTRLARGFTLLELVVGIVVFSIALAIITTIIAPQAYRSVDPIMQVRATELAQSLLNEISARAYDEQSDRVTGIVRCNETVTDSDGIDRFRACTAANQLGPDGSERRTEYDDVDDYHGLVTATTENSLGENLANLYAGFSAQVAVFYDNDFNGVKDDPALAEKNFKLISIIVTTPTGEQMRFSTYRGNY